MKDQIVIKYHKANDDLYAIIGEFENDMIVSYSVVGQHSEACLIYVKESLTYRRSNGMFDRVNELIGDLALCGYDINQIINSDV